MLKLNRLGRNAESFSYRLVVMKTTSPRDGEETEFDYEDVILEWMRSGVKPPETVLDALKRRKIWAYDPNTFLHEQAKSAGFLAKRCQILAEKKVPGSDDYKHWKEQSLYWEKQSQIWEEESQFWEKQSQFWEKQSPFWKQSWEDDSQYWQ